ncbi:hypothetical protein [Companilactobacillus sp. HBUAS56275]|jgi:hypothetical protein|uniref:Uncharacterized protein n=1 Tax=Candidatus Companilactobacillus pullicola TaxID=2838523 RepID=A0A9D1ZLS1_9LACO|nr:hypothetical protein [Candidatus Companilactobacillus pullicola]
MSLLYTLFLILYPLVLICLIDRHFHVMDMKTQKFDLDLNLIISKSYVYTVVYLVIIIPIIFVYFYFSLGLMKDMWSTVLIVLKGVDVLLTGLILIFCGSQLLIFNRSIKKLI